MDSAKSSGSEYTHQPCRGSKKPDDNVNPDFIKRGKTEIANKGIKKFFPPFTLSLRYLLATNIELIEINPPVLNTLAERAARLRTRTFLVRSSWLSVLVRKAQPSREDPKTLTPTV